MCQKFMTNIHVSEEMTNFKISIITKNIVTGLVTGKSKISGNALS